MLATRMRMGAGGYAKPVDCTHVDNAVILASQTTFTFSEKSLGAAKDDRYIVVTAGGRVSISRTVNACTIAGVTATRVASTSSFNPTAIFIAAVPIGATGDIVVTFSGSMGSAGIGVYRLTNLQSAIPTDSVQNNTSAQVMSGTLTIPVDGCGVGYVNGFVSGGLTWVWSNLSEDYDEALSANTCHSGAMSSTEVGTLTRTATANETPTNVNLVLAAWR
jgi:hypothetical protein